VRSWRAALLAAVAFLGPVAVPAAAGCAGVHASGRWAAIDLPAGTTSDVTAVDAGRGKNGADVLLAAGGRALWRSADGGCTWSTVLSLDTVPSTSPTGSPLAAIWSIGVSPSSRPGPRSAYVVAGEGFSNYLAALPVTTFASADDGLHWTRHEASPNDLAGDFPRCSSQPDTIVLPGAEAATAYLRCGANGSAEVGTEVAGPVCRFAWYVTRDAAATWQAVEPRYSDPNAISQENTSGCGHTARTFAYPVPDADTPHLVWVPPGCENTLLRSTDDGKTLKTYATISPPAWSCFTRATFSTLPDKRPVAAICDSHNLWVVTRSGKAEPAPIPRLRIEERGLINGCDLVRGTAGVVMTYYDGQGRCRAFRYDVVHRSWRDLGFAPLLGTNAWRDYDRVAGSSVRGSRTVYLRAAGGSRVFRVTV
jgi:hypothetical protein